MVAGGRRPAGKAPWRAGDYVGARRRCQSCGRQAGCGVAEFDCSDLAREYCGKAPSTVEATGILLKLHSAPMYFYRKGRGRYRAAPPETLRAALAGIEKRKQRELQIDQWSARLAKGELPEELHAVLDQLL